MKSPETWELQIACHPTINDSKKKAWIDIFNIESRYKAKITKESYRWKQELLLEYHKKSRRSRFVLNEFIKDEKERYENIFDHENFHSLKMFL